MQDSWRPASNLTIEGGVRYVLWPPFHALDGNIATFNPAYYSIADQAVLDPATGRIVSGPRYNGIVLPGNGFPSSASDLAVYNDPAVKALFVGAPDGLTETHKNVFEPRVGVSYGLNDKTIVKVSSGVFHNRVTLNDSLLLGGNPPFQPQVGASNGSVDNPGGVGGSASLPFGMTAIDPVFKHPTALHVLGRRAARGAARASSSTRPTSDAGAATCSASATSTSCRRAPAGQPGRSTPTTCASTRATASSGCRRTSAARPTTACS